jgi:hypothetical protein
MGFWEIRVWLAVFALVILAAGWGWLESFLIAGITG